VTIAAETKRSDGERRAGLGSLIAASFSQEADRWMLWLPVFLASGIGFYFALPIEPPLWLGLTMLCLSATALIAARTRPALKWFLAVLMAASLGLTVAQWRTVLVAAPVLPKEQWADVTGQVLDVEVDPPGARITLDHVTIAGIAVDRERIYVTDSQVTSVQVFDRKGNFIKGWGRHEMGAQNFSLPEGIAVDGKGRVFVVDAMRHEVKVFDAEGALLDIFGGPGSTAGSLLYPADIAIDGTGRVYVVERGNGRVQIFAEEELPATARKREP